MHRPFDECWERIARAKSHREAAGRAWNAFLDEHPYDASVDVDDDGTGRIWVEQLAPVPSVIAFEIGEFLYHLRAVLDACVYEAACLNIGQRPPPDEDRLEFVIRDSPGQFQNALRKLAPLTQQQRDFVESVQPYRTPPLESKLLPLNYNRGLAMLHDWARKDRHRRLHVIATWASDVKPRLLIPAGTRVAEFAVPFDTFILKDKSQIASFRLAGWERGMKISANPNLSLEMTVDELPRPCHRNDRIDVRLQCMINAVAEVVGSIASTYDAKLFE